MWDVKARFAKQFRWRRRREKCWNQWRAPGARRQEIDEGRACASELARQIAQKRSSSAGQASVGDARLRGRHQGSGARLIRPSRAPVAPRGLRRWFNQRTSPRPSAISPPSRGKSLRKEPKPIKLQPMDAADEVEARINNVLSILGCALRRRGICKLCVRWRPGRHARRRVNSWWRKSLTLELDLPWLRGTGGVGLRKEHAAVRGRAEQHFVLVDCRPAPRILRKMAEKFPR